MSFANDIAKDGFTKKGSETIVRKYGKYTGYSEIDDQVHATIVKIQGLAVGNGMPDNTKRNTWGPLAQLYDRLHKELKKSERFAPTFKTEKKVCAEYLRALSVRMEVLADWQATGVKGNQVDPNNVNVKGAQHPVSQREAAQRQAAQQHAMQQQADARQAAQEQAAARRLADRRAAEERERQMQQQVRAQAQDEDVDALDLGGDAGRNRRDREQQQRVTPGDPREKGGEDDHGIDANAREADLAAIEEKAWAKEKPMVEKLDLLLTKSQASVAAQAKKAKPSLYEAVRYMNAAEKTFKEKVGDGQAGRALATFESDLETIDIRYGLTTKSTDLLNRAKDLIAETAKLNSARYKSNQAKAKVRQERIMKGFAGMVMSETKEFCDNVQHILKVKEIKIREANAEVQRIGAMAGQ
jgi:hypothetical protein